ncbi:hypothetical protein C8Q79DRAFT_735237 [Trametes meyenii]|nr:hypothetical protein C8Q79DRAFT_735237 [Trametes meyenii]
MKRRLQPEKRRARPLYQIEAGIFAMQSPDSCPNEKQHTFVEQGHFPNATQFNEDAFPHLACPRSIVSHPARLPSLFTLAHSPVNGALRRRASDELPAILLEEGLHSQGQVRLDSRDAYAAHMQPDVELGSDIDSARAQRSSSVATHSSPTALSRAIPSNQITRQSRKHSETSTPLSTPRTTPFTYQDLTTSALQLTRSGRGPSRAPSNPSDSPEQLLQLTLPWSLGQRVLAMMVGSMSQRQSDEATESGGDSDPPPAYEASRSTHP